MLHCNIIDISEGIDPTKSNKIDFLNHGFKFQDSVCNSCHNLTILCLDISDIVIITVINVNYCRIFHNINKSEAVNLLENSVLEDSLFI